MNHMPEISKTEASNISKDDQQILFKFPNNASANVFFFLHFIVARRILYDFESRIDFLFPIFSLYNCRDGRDVEILLCHCHNLFEYLFARENYTNYSNDSSKKLQPSSTAPFRHELPTESFHSLVLINFSALFLLYNSN